MPSTSLVAFLAVAVLAALVLVQWSMIQRARRRAADSTSRLRELEDENAKMRQLLEDLARSRETILDALKPRGVSGLQRQVLAEALSQASGRVSLEVRVAADLEAEGFAAELKSALEAGGADVLLHRVFGVGPSSLERGDTLRILRSDRGGLVKDALSAAGIELRTIDWPAPPVPAEADAPELAAIPDAVIIIGRRETVAR